MAAGQGACSLPSDRVNGRSAAAAARRLRVARLHEALRVAGVPLISWRGRRRRMADTSGGAGGSGAGSSSAAAGERWHPLLLEDGEYLFREHAAYWLDGGKRCGGVEGGGRACCGGGARARLPCAVPPQTPPGGPGRRLGGTLRVCSQGLYFAPKDVNYPVFRVPYRATTSIEG